MRHATRWGLGLLLAGFWLAPGSLWAGDFTFHNAATANATGSNASVSDRGSVGISVTISGTATVTFEGSADGVTFSAILCTLLGQTDTASSTTTSGQYLCSVGGLKHVQTPLSGCAGCTVTVKGVTSTASRGGGSGGGVTGWPSSSTTKEITWANSLANAMRVGDGTTPMCLYTDATLGPTSRPCTASDTETLVLTNQNWRLWDEEGALAIETVDPDAATKNAMYQYGTNYKPLLSIYPSLSPRGVASVSEESLNTNFEKRAWAIVTDVDTDALDFHFPVTLKMVGATTMTVRLVGASKNAAPAGNIVFSCAAIAIRPGTDTYAAHSTTGEQTVTLTPATQYRPVAATSAAITLNGTVADGGEIVGSCEVDAGGTTSAQMTDFRLSADARIQLLVNSRSD